MVGVCVCDTASGNSEGGVLDGLEFGDGGVRGNGGPCGACVFQNGAGDGFEGVCDGFNGFAPFGGGERFEDVCGLFGFLGCVFDVSGKGELWIVGDAENFGVGDGGYDGVIDGEG